MKPARTHWPSFASSSVLSGKRQGFSFKERRHEPGKAGWNEDDGAGNGAGNQIAESLDLVQL